MKGTKGKMGALLLALALAAGGCGEQPMTLTEEEEAVIVNYAAHIVSKFNTRQPDGMVYVSETLYQEKTGGEEPDIPDTEDTENIGNEGGEQTSGGEEQTPAQTMSLTDALGIDGITAECTGSRLSPSYQDETYYSSQNSLDASEGKIFLILNVALTNTSESDIECDMRKSEFTAEVNGSVRTKATKTILLNDLGTYQGTVAAGQSVDTVLLFEISGDIMEVESVRLTLQTDGASRDTDL